jgi:hypothetical protein
MGTRRFVALAALLAALVTAGCARDIGRSAEPGGSVSPSAPNGPGGSPSASWHINPPSPSDDKYPAGEMTLTGRVEAGVEAGCMIMQASGQTYLLLGGNREVVQPGAWITVRGKPNPNLMTTCMQGMPFEISEAHKA